MLTAKRRHESDRILGNPRFICISLHGFDSVDTCRTYVTSKSD